MILDRIAARTRERVCALKDRKSLAQVTAEAEAMPARTGFPFEQALGAPDIAFICEVKKASPSKGVIAADFPYLAIAKAYAQAGAAALSVLTEPCFVLGSDRHLTEIAQGVNLPVLQKDFIVDPYQIYEAKILGASAVLLICALLDADALAEYLSIAHRLGLSALVEGHTQAQVRMALQAGARVIGVNNRDLNTFTVDVTTGVRLRPLVPKEILFVAESGIQTPEDVAFLRAAGADAVLIGETLMRSPDPRRELARLRGEPDAED